MDAASCIGRSTLVVMLLCAGGSVSGADAALADTVERIKPAIVGVGTYSATRRSPAALLGTGFIVDGGQRAATNFHVVDRELDDAHKEQFVIFIGRGRQVEYRPVRLLAVDERHDLALLAFDGPALPALTLVGDEVPREGSAIAFTGFPLGAVLGLYPVTHQGIVSALTPLATPASDAGQLSAERIAALRDPFEVLQLDATAYPGNSGSPVYEQATGRVIGIVNQVFVKGKKENALRDPSAITYAIPARYLAALLERQ